MNKEMTEEKHVCLCACRFVHI